MAWEYLENLDERYDIAATYIKPHEKVVDVNSGNSRLRLRVEHYFSNDLYDNRADVQCTDEEFVPMVKECDVLCCFGIGGHEVTGEELESATVTHSLIALCNAYKPRRMILECIDDFVPVVENILSQTGYTIDEKIEKTYDTFVPEELKYVEKRNLFICKQ